jgi:competence protein ComEC
LLLVCVIVLGLALGFSKKDAQETRVLFFDVGQGDAALISDGPYQVLIDGGENGRRLREYLGEWLPWEDNTIDIIIPTHPDADHIGGLPEVARFF